ncbi:MAG: hypothetical protein ACI4J2_09840 [Ruminococcus sp.]
MEIQEMPMGLGMALAQNPEAMIKFSQMTEQEKNRIISGTHSITSKEEMRRYVDNIITSASKYR